MSTATGMASDDALMAQGSTAREDHACRPRDKRRARLVGLALGQAISLLMAATGVFSTLLVSSRGISIPTTQSALNYVILSFYLCRRERRPLRIPWWRYLLVAACDVEANFLVVLAYRYTSITSVMLLDCFSIPMAMLYSRVFIGSRYRTSHLLGVFICLAGLACTVLSDFVAAGTGGPSDGSYPHAVTGDICCLVGAALYAASNVMQESICKNHDRVEFLGMLGALSSCISIVQALCLEIGAIQRAPWDVQSVGLVVGFSVTLAIIYSFTATFLVEADATLFNLSLLSSDIYAVAYRWGFQRQSVNWLYALAFGCMAIGLSVYQVSPPVNARPKSESRNRSRMVCEGACLLAPETKCSLDIEQNLIEVPGHRQEGDRDKYLVTALSRSPPR